MGFGTSEGLYFPSVVAERGQWIQSGERPAPRERKGNRAERRKAGPGGQWLQVGGVRGAVERAGELVRVGDLGRVRERAGAREGEGRPR